VIFSASSLARLIFVKPRIDRSGWRLDGRGRAARQFSPSHLFLYEIHAGVI
jgi:hypothetical protein